MALIGVFLLIGIVKKNGILIIDFALRPARAWLERRRRARGGAAALPPDHDDAGRGAGRTAAGDRLRRGALRQPLGVTIIGGLIASQLLTLLTTPAVYVLLDKLRRRATRRSWRAESPECRP